MIRDLLDALAAMTGIASGGDTLPFGPDLPEAS